MLKGKSVKIILLLNLVFIASIIFFCCTPTQELIMAKANNENFIITQGMYDNYTDSDYLFNSNSQKITDYPTDESLYKASSSIVANEGVLSASILDDDNIVKIIPKELFINIGDHLYIGKEYGFYVNTVAQAINSNNRRSTVMVFDITTQNNFIETVDNFIVELTPIFQYEYVYLTCEESVFYISSIENKEIYNKQVSYSTTKPVVIPIAVVNNLGTAVNYELIEKYYLKDICFTAQVLNEQALNQNDANYNCIQDNGAFFIAVDYTYDGLSRYIIEPTTEQQVIFALDTVSVALGITSLVVPDFGLLGLLSTVLSSSSYAYNLSTSNYEVLMQGEADFETISSGQLTTKRLYTTKTSQMAQYGGLVKAAGVCVNSNGKDSIWYGTNSNAAAYFTVSNGGDEYARYYREIGLQIVDSEGNQKCIGSSIYHYLYGNPIAQEIQFEEETAVYLLPSGNNLFVFDAPFLSDYKLTVNSNEEVALKVNNNIITGINNVFTTRINESDNVSIQVYGNVNAVNTSIKIEPSSTLTNISIPANGKYLLFVDILTIDCKVISLTNSTISIDNIFTVENGALQNYTLNSINVSSSNSLNVALDIGKKYFLLSNLNNQLEITNMVFSEVAVIDIGINSNKTICIGNYTYQKFITSNTATYAFTFDFDEAIIAMNIFDLNFNAVASYRTDKTMFAMNLYGTYWIAYRNNDNLATSQITGDIIISIEDNAYKWMVDGTEVVSQDVFLEIGEQYELELWINNSEKINDLFLSMGMNCALSSSGILDISFDCPTRQREIIIVTNIVIGTNFPPPALYITPVPSSKISIINSVNTQTQLGFVWQISSTEITSFKYTISNGVEYQVTVSNSISGTVDIISTVDYNAIYATIIITKIGIGEMEYAYNGDESSSYYMNVCFDSGTGTEADPFLIKYPRHFNNLKYVSKPNTNYYYKQMQNLDFQGSATERNVSFYGNYNSNAKSITNVVISSNGSLVGGLFSENYGRISSFLSLSITINASGQGAMVGGMVGINYGELYAALFCTINIESYWEQGAVGGIAGKNEVGAIIIPGTTSGTIKAKSDVGGIAGVNNGTINSGICGVEITYYQYTAVNRSIGGIVGLNNPAGSLIGSMTFCGNIIYGGYTIWYSSWSGSSVNMDIDPRIGKIIGENCANVGEKLTASFSYSNASINVGLLFDTQKEYISAFGYIGNNKA